MKNSIAILLMACALSAMPSTVNANQKHVTEIGINQAAEMQLPDFNHDVCVIEALPKMDVAVFVLENTTIDENSIVAVKFNVQSGNYEKNSVIFESPVRLIPWRTGESIVFISHNTLLHKEIWLTNCTIRQC